MKRIGWHSRARIEALQHLLDAQLAQWSEQWCGTDATRGVLTRLAGRDDIVSRMKGDCMHWAESDATLSYASSLELTLGQELLQHEGGDPAFARAIGRQALGDLGTRLLGIAAATSCRHGEGLADEGDDERTGALFFLVTLAGGPVRIAVNRAWCERQPGESMTARAHAPLTERRQALGESTTTLHARLPLGEIGLFESLNLVVGEILVTDVACDARVQLETADDPRPIAAGRLHLHAGQRCVELN